jgi:hypothetical protein
VISASRVVTATIGRSRQRRPRKSRLRETAAIQSGDSEATVGLAVGARSAGRRLDQRHRLVVAVKQAQRPHEMRLRLKGDHAGAERAKMADAVPEMGADVEAQRPRLHERGIEGAGAAALPRIAVVDDGRARDTVPAPQRLRCAVRFAGRWGHGPP